MSGTLTHAGLEAFYQGKTLEEALDILRTTAFDYKADYVISHDVMPRVLTAEAMAVALLTGYYKKHEQVKYEDVRTEISLGMEILPDLYYLGTIDLLIHDGEDWILFDHKTASRINEDTMRTLDMDLQLNSYTHLIFNCLSTQINKVIYNILIKPAIKQRKGTKNRAGDTPHDYHMRLIEQTTELPEKYYHQESWYYNPARSREVWDDIIVLARDIKGKLDSPDGYTNPNVWARNCKRCFDYNSACPFMRLCHVGYTAGNIGMLAARRGLERGEIITPNGVITENRKGETN